MGAVSDASTAAAPARRHRKSQGPLLRWLGWGLGLAVVIYLPFVLADRAIFGYRLTNMQLLNIGLAQVNLTLVAIMGAVSLNYLTGCAGLVSIGHAALLAVGAMAAAAVGVQFGLPFPLALIAAALAGAIAGVLAGLPSLRVRGLYFVLSTMALHFIVVFLFSEYQYAAFDLVGISFPEPNFFGFALNSSIRWYFFLLPIVILCCFGLSNSLRRREGMALLAMRDNELAAAASGIDVRILRLKVFALSSAVAALAGALQAYFLTTVTAEHYSLNMAISFIAMIIIGGMGSIAGGVIGAVFWLLLPSVISGFASQLPATDGGLSRLIVDSRPHVTMLIFGIIVTLILIFARGGIVGMAHGIRRALARHLNWGA